jgi:hypothetical protein
VSWAPATAIRFGLAAGALALGLVATRSTLANVLAPRRPLAAAQIDPANALAAAQAAQALVSAGERADSPAVGGLTRAALRRDLTIPAAIEVRAIQLQSSGDPAGAEALVNSSLAISRRSLGTHLWLIQRSVEKGDVGGALTEFDRALRTSSKAPPLLFPVLARATADPGLQAPIAHLLDRPSDWREMFLNFAIERSGRVESIAPVVLRMRDSNMAAKVELKLVEALVQRNAFALARRVDDRFAKGEARGALLRDPNFGDRQAQSPFGWALDESSTSWGFRDRIAGAPVLGFRASPGGHGQVANQLLTLAPGNYALRTVTAAAPKDPEAVPYWTVSCAGQHPVRIAELDQPARPGQAAEARFSVPAGCAGQWIELILRGSDLPDGQSGAVRSVDIRRL